MAVIETNVLTKKYGRGKLTAVDALNLRVEAGGVHGFLGPNGSGKTTTIRCLLGLIRPSGGAVRLFGQDTTSSPQSVIDRVGALVETPKFFPNFSGKKNLRMLAGITGISKQAVDESLATVGLAERSSDRYGTYSLGMKQRLAIAATLLKNPELIVLDEPANGLDPAGIVEIRQLLRQLGEQGRTVFVSSHQLNEIQQTCDFVTIISKGRFVTSGTVADVIANASGPARMKVIIDEPSQAAATLSGVGFAVSPTGQPESLFVDVGIEHGAEISRTLAIAGLFPKAMVPQEASLESTFLELTAGEGSL